MKIKDVVTYLESLAHPSLQENYDNAGLITGDTNKECKGIICSLDTTEDVINEAISKNCNMVVSHHPIIFSGLKKITGKNYIEKAIIAAIKNDISVYAIHTNLDNTIEGVSGKMAGMLGLKNISTLAAKSNTLKKLYTFAPIDKADQVRNALFAAGGGQIGNYNECSFNTQGTGTFKAQEGANPHVGEINKRHHETEIKIEVIFPAFLESALISSLKMAHPYEEVAYDIIRLSNTYKNYGAGVIGELPEPMTEAFFLNVLKETFMVPVVRHSPLINKPVSKIALCGGAGKFLIPTALSSGADFFVTADIKYHDFFDSNGKMVIADVGHFESEQFTIDLLQEILEQKFPTFAILKTEVKTNPVNYFF